MTPFAWWHLLAEGRFRFSLARVPLVIAITFWTIPNFILSLLQKLLYSGKVRQSELHGPPVFIVGHWRSGTTLLHELMVRDERFSSPSTYQCFAPSHFLLTEWFFRRYANWLLPGKRPMDNMAAGWERPQEDEFAMLTKGLPSPYRRMAFPNNEPPDLEYLDFDQVPEPAVQSWFQQLREFLTAVSISCGRPLVVKSPTHTGRIAHLAREFPEAKIIHITRDPVSLFPSTCRLWRSLDQVQALQTPDGRQVEQYVLDCFRRMYGAFFRQRDRVAEHRMIEIRYEDLVDDPVATLRRIYETLKLSDFDAVAPVIEEWVNKEHKGYQPNRHNLPADQLERIQVEWKEYFQRYGYL